MSQTLKLKLVLRPVLWQFQQFLHICLCFADNLVRGLCRSLCASHLQQPLKDRSEISRYFKATAASSNLCVQILYDFQALHLYCNCILKKILLRLSAVVLRLYGISLSLSVYFLFRFWTFIPSLVPTNILREWRAFDNWLVVLLQLPHIDLTELLLQFSKPGLLLRIEHGSDRWCLITMPMLSTPVTGFSYVVLACAPEISKHAHATLVHYKRRL